MDIPPDSAAALIKGGLDAAKAVGESPAGQAVGANLGDGAVVVSRTIRNIFLPLALYNAKREAYFKEKFEAELSAKVKVIPEEHRQEPKASVVAPAIEGLGYAYEEEELRELYLNLLASSVDARVAAGLHPAFGELVKQLTAAEVALLNVTLTGPVSIGVARIRVLIAGTESGLTVHNHLMNPTLIETGLPWLHPDIPSWVDNWIRLGIVDVDYGRQLTADDAYDWVEQRPEYIGIRETRTDEDHDVTFERGLLTVTDFGQRFARAVAPREAA